jgi:hypothetical protein
MNRIAAPTACRNVRSPWPSDRNPRGCRLNSGLGRKPPYIQSVRAGETAYRLAQTIVADCTRERDTEAHTDQVGPGIGRRAAEIDADPLYQFERTLGRLAKHRAGNDVGDDSARA